MNNTPSWLDRANDAWAAFSGFKRTLIVIGGIILTISILNAFEPDPPSKPLTAAEQRRALVEKQFSSWNGAHRNLEERVKAALNDPDSYEHIETKYQDRGKYIFLRMKFRGANLFGGKVVNEVMATAAIDGTLLTVQMVEP